VAAAFNAFSQPFKNFLHFFWERRNVFINGIINRFCFVPYYRRPQGFRRISIHEKEQACVNCQHSGFLLPESVKAMGRAKPAQIMTPVPSGEKISCLLNVDEHHHYRTPRKEATIPFKKSQGIFFYLSLGHGSRDQRRAFIHGFANNRRVPDPAQNEN